MTASDGPAVPFKKSALYRRLRSVKHGMICAVGTGQHGKTVSVHSLIDSGVFGGRNVALVNYSPGFVDKYPYPGNYRAVKWPKDLKDLLKVVEPSKDVLVLDDAIFLAGARDSTTKDNKNLQKIMTIISHQEIFVVLTIQNTSLIDIGMMQSQDVYMLHKFMDTTALALERPHAQLNQIIANSLLAQYKARYPSVHPKSWAYCSATHEMISFSLPPWWVDAMSKPFYGVIPDL